MNKAVAIALVAAGMMIGAGVAVYYYTRKPEKIETKAPDTPPDTPREKAPVPKVKFTLINDKAGVQFDHVNGAFGLKLLPETMGSGCAFLDYDNDGHQDLLLINSRAWPGDSSGKAPATMKLYRNKGNGTFEDKTVEAGLNIPLYGQGVCAGDIDNDGFIDVYVSAIGGSRLFRNDGGKKFVDITQSAGVSGGGNWPILSREAFLAIGKPIPWPSSATFLDYDGDGLLDLFVCQYVTWSPKKDLDSKFTLDAGNTRAYGPPRQYEGSQCILYRNVDGKRFEDVSEKAGIHVTELEGIGEGDRKRSAAKALGVIVGDPDGDGWPDIVVANDTVRNFFFHNVAGADGKREFKERGIAVGLGLSGGAARGGMGIDWIEFLPGEWAIAIANFASEPTTFFCQDMVAKSQRNRVLFEDLAVGVGLSGPTLSPLKFGTFFFDYDLDGRPDMLTNNGHLEPEISLTQSQQYKQAPQLFWNTGNRSGCFEPVTAADAGADLFVPLVGRGSAFADIDGDGDLDVVLTANGGTARLFRNDCDLKHHWVRLVLQGDGKRSNRSAIGAVVTIEAGGKSQTRMVAGGRGYLSQSELPITFGLGDVKKIDKVTIKWPGKNAGPPTVLTDVEVDKSRTVKQ